MEKQNQYMLLISNYSQLASSILHDKPLYMPSHSTEIRRNEEREIEIKCVPLTKIIFMN
ncbi:hypothetical protein STEG23_017255, partial [Scotinomys teguina]